MRQVPRLTTISLDDSYMLESLVSHTAAERTGKGLSDWSLDGQGTYMTVAFP